MIKCAVIYASEFWFINKTQHMVSVHAYRLSSRDEEQTVKLRAGEWNKGGALVLAEQFDNPERYYFFIAEQVKKGRKKPRYFICECTHFST